MPMGFEAWKEAVEMPELEPASIDTFDSGPLMLEAAEQGLGVALMHASPYHQATDSRLVRLFDVSVKSPYRYWFVCRPQALQSRAGTFFPDWIDWKNVV